MNTREVNVAVEGLDPRAIAGSFSVHLIKDGRRIASRFFFQDSDGADSPQSDIARTPAHFDFILPIGAVADGKLSVEIEPAELPLSHERSLVGQMGRATLSVYLMLEPD